MEDEEDQENGSVEDLRTCSWNLICIFKNYCFVEYKRPKKNFNEFLLPFYRLTYHDQVINPYKVIYKVYI